MEVIDSLARFSLLLPHADSSWVRNTLSIAFVLDSYSFDHVNYHPVLLITIIAQWGHSIALRVIIALSSSGRPYWKQCAICNESSSHPW